MSSSFFSPKLDKAEASGKARVAVSAKGWPKVYLEGQKLFFIPTWFFSYYIFWEKTNEEGEKIVSREKRGFGVIDSSTSEFSEWLVHLAENASSFSSQDQMPITADALQLISKLEEPQAREIAITGIASRNAAAKQNVLILDLSLFFVPVWKIKGVAADSHFSCSVEAVSGKVLFEQDVPYRKKTRREIINDSFLEATNPLAWIGFFKRTANRLVKMFSKTVQDYDAATLILIAVLIIVALWAMRFF